MKDGAGRGSFLEFEARRKADRIGRVVLVGSGKGGVGKSLVACGLALELSKIGFATGILDVDLHGASVPAYLGVGPPLSSTQAGLSPKKVGGLEVMSTSLLTGDETVPLRGRVKHDTIAELFALTAWGDLDFLVVDLPPSTGDEVLSAFEIFRGRAELILVTTPSKVSLGVVGRLGKLASSEGVPVLGVVVNMAYERTAGSRRAYPFGRASAAEVSSALGARVLAETPVSEEVNSKGLLYAIESDGGLLRPLKRLASLVSSGERGL